MKKIMPKIFLSILLTIFFTLSVNAKSEDFITYVTITTYNPTSSQCDATPLITANGTKIDLTKLKQGKIKYVAVSRDLRWCLPYGSIIKIEGYGLYEVVDTMHPRFNHCIDILQDKSKKNFKKTNVKVTLVKKKA